MFFFVFFCYLFDLLAYFIRWLKVSWNRTIHEKLRQECLVKTCKSEVLNLAFLKKNTRKEVSVRWVFWFEKVSLRPFFYPNRTGAVCCWISDARLFCQISHECQLTPDVFTLIGHAGGRAIGMCELKKFRIGGRL